MVALRDRFSPACAGNGCEQRVPAGLSAVQPRVCGERPPGDRIEDRPYGSAPRVRGTGACARRVHGAARFSPACAGNGAPVRRIAGLSAGSAPRVRGTAPWIQRRLVRERFSPACAGNGNHFLVVGPVSSVQPRVCGERPCARKSVFAAPGSAPRVRGTEVLGNRGIAQIRFSPACAGNGLK